MALTFTRCLELLVVGVFYAGLCYMIFGGVARHIQSTPLMQSMKKPVKLVMITALHDKPCKYPNGDYLNLISILNKQDYARLHDYPIVVATRLADPTLHNMWNKIGTILKVMDDYPDMDWYLWIDSDAMIIDVNFLLPFQRFGGKDLIIWGNETRLALGDGRRGINSGVMLFRNVPWSREILEEVADLGRIPEPGLESVLMEELTSPEYTYDPGLRDQNALSYLLKRDWKKNMPHVELVNRQYCLNCYWRDLLELGTLTSDDTRVHFINHFSGCQLCTQQNKNDDYKECENEMIKSYEYADTAMTRLLARKPPRNITFHLPVAECHYCQKHPKAKECVDAIAAVEAWEEQEASVAQEHFKKHSGNAQHKSRSLIAVDTETVERRAYSEVEAPWERKAKLTGIGALPGF